MLKKDEAPHSESPGSLHRYLFIKNSFLRFGSQIVRRSFVFERSLFLQLNLIKIFLQILVYAFDPVGAAAAIGLADALCGEAVEERAVRIQIFRG